jgi:DNA-binding NtrC family response regulator
MNEKILILDDDAGIRQFLTIALKRDGYDAMSMASPGEGLKRLKEEKYDVAIVDLKMPEFDGITALKKMKGISPELSVIMITAFATIESAIEAMKKGAFDYITKPFKIDEIRLIIEKALKEKRLIQENKILNRELTARSGFSSIIGESPPMQKVFAMIKKLAKTDSTVLIYGESGTGKELAARAIHYTGSRTNRPFTAIDCSAIPETLLESELFGHERGAFTSAFKTKEGLFEIAKEGTIFLDEIGAAGLGIQARLLRVLQEKEFRRVGGIKDIKVNSRVIAATNRKLDEEVVKGNFRQDLFFRLNVVPIHLPPLRERKEDITALAKHFLVKFSKRENKKTRDISREALTLLENYPWPGNVRELEHLIERAVILTSGKIITPIDLPLRIQEKGRETVQKNGSLRDLVEEYERRLIADTLQECEGNKFKTARVLGLSRQNLQYKIKKYEM